LGLVYAETLDNAIPKCPTVFDGHTHTLYDLSTQFSQNTISANWVGLNPSEVIGYEWAIISDKKAAKLSSGCRLSQGFNGIPDVLDWTSVRKQSSVTGNRLTLVPETTYYVVLRTTLQNGVHVYSNSNGIVVLPSELEEQFTPKEVSKTNSRETRITQKDPHTNFIINGDSCILYGETCDIDNENRCRASKVTVHDYLNTIYGKAKFPVITPIPPIVIVEETRTYDDDEDDDEGDINNGIVIATVVGGVLFFLIPLLILCCIACVLNRNDDDDKFTDQIREKDVEQVDADGGTFKEHSIGAENTKVEFPDIDPHNRLSVA
jgi:hypothetical protein